MSQSNAPDAATTPAFAGPSVPPGAADPTKLREVHKLALGRTLLACRFDPTGKFVVAGGMNRQVTRCAVSGGQLGPGVHFDGHASWVAAIAFHPQGKFVYCGDHAGTIICRSLPQNDGQPVWTQEAHRGWIRGLAVSPDGRYLASCGNDQRVRLWSALDARLVHELEPHDSHVYNVAFHPAGAGLVSADLKGAIRHWEIDSGKLLRTFEASQCFVQQANIRLGGVRCIAFHPDGKTLACGGMSGIGSIGDGIGAPTVVLFDWETTKADPDLLPKETARTFVNGIAFHPAGFILGATGGLDRGYLLVWKRGQKETVFQTKLPESAWSMDLHPDGLRLVMGHHDQHLRLYDMLPAPAKAAS